MDIEWRALHDPLENTGTHQARQNIIIVEGRVDWENAICRH